MLEHLWFPHDISTFGPRVDFLFEVIFWITMTTWALVTIAMVAFLFMYRTRPGRKASYIEGNPRLEVIWTVATAVIMVVLAMISRSTWVDIKEAGPPGEVFYKVTAKQFNWEITYPGPDGKFDTADDRTFENEIHFPVGKPISIHLRSQDVIHSFFVPSFRFKQDAVPGHDIRQWFEVTKVGKYEVPCAELCGFGHSGMRGWAYAQTPEDYAKWLAENVNAPAAATAAPGSAGETAAPPAAPGKGKGMGKR